MAVREGLGQNVFDVALQRMIDLYESGARVVVSVSGGKDSTICMEVTLLAAKMTGNLPVDVVTRDEEIMFPGTYEYLERVAERPDVRMHWLVANQPIINAYNRANPYFWVFDPLLPPSSWVRQPPPWATYIEEKDITSMTIPSRFPVQAGQELFAVIGLRASESMMRKYSVFSAGGHLTKPNSKGTRNCRPIYDWQDTDVWKAIHEFGWDHNTAYDTLYRMGARGGMLRIAPPTMNFMGADLLMVGSRAWPAWFDRVATRCPGVRTGAQFGKLAVTPQRHHDETWEECFRRTCVNDAPEWIAERASSVLAKVLRAHGKHSTAPFPERKPCRTCQANIGSWRRMAMAMYGGDPFCTKQGFLSAVEPEYFRPGSGQWGGRPAF